MNNEKLLNRNFLMVVIGQMVSIFGNAVLRFALPLYILDQTGSSTIFGTILAIATIPTLLFSPLGGIMADRFNRRNLMVILDLLTAAVIGGFSFFLSTGPIVLVIAALMVIFSIIQSFYQPAVQASIPLISSKDNLEKANGFISLVNALSNLLAPLFAGILYGALGIRPIMISAVICFFLAAVMEMFIIMRFERKHHDESIISIIRSDLKVSINYMVKDTPVIIKAMLVISGINLFLTPVILVGLPAIIKIKLALSSQLYGLTQGVMAAGMIIGGIIISVIGKKIEIEEVYKMLFYASMGLLPIALSLSIKMSVMVVYWTISICCFVITIFITMCNITMISFIQRETPDHLIGKVISYIFMMARSTLPVGQAMYGFLFEVVIDYLNILLFVTALCSGWIAVYSKRVFSALPAKAKYDSVSH
ncbi:MFS transporter [Halocella sp. SP3-1]|uniref:MFS transporter n=1 Tax=Halocella sp. SP3-1 TaxID=2382161 RepID=UPI000F756F56|nr:MFS transporter [Halocella sp. SP3-1]AZO94636.1 MFS transporter [Halocella sp. SP3-1]